MPLSKIKIFFNISFSSPARAKYINTPTNRGVDDKPNPKP